MVVLIVLLAIIAMMWNDWRDGRRQGPRPTRTKLVYGIMLILILYHASVVFNWRKLPTFYISENAIFGPAANSLERWFDAKG